MKRSRPKMTTKIEGISIGGVPPAASAGYRLESLTQAGQIKKGDNLIILSADGVQTVKVPMVINSGSSLEEIITNKRKNKYFITSMYLDRTSWAKDVAIIR